MKFKNILFITTLSLAVFGCEDELNLEPSQSLSTEEALSDFSSLQTALYGAYDALQDVNYYGRDFIVIPEVGGDNVYITINNSNRFLINYRYELGPNSTQGAFWADAYEAILNANNIINNINLAADASETERNQVLGEALAIRALVHHDLVKTFALPYGEGNGAQLGVPVVTESTLDEPARNTVGQVYTQIVDDLTRARDLMTMEVGPYRFTSLAAEALLARVYLFMEDYDAAEASATNVISSEQFDLVDGEELKEFWSTSGTSEEIFTLARQPDETLGSDNLGQIFNPQGYGDIRVTEDLRELYEAEDHRTDLYYLEPEIGEYFVGKYLGEQGVPGLVSPKLIRLAEVYLIRAEARANQEDYEGAVDDLNVIKDRAGASLIESIDDSEVLSEVIEERRRELAFEGHRTFTLWRNGLPLTRNQCNTGIEINAPCFIAADSYLRIYPIPQYERDVNPNLEQNEPYD